MKDQLVTFKSKLEEFAMKHKSDIRRDPVFRAQFHTMCANIGVDPLASNKVCWQYIHTPAWAICQHMLFMRAKQMDTCACVPLRSTDSCAGAHLFRPLLVCVCGGGSIEAAAACRDAYLQIANIAAAAMQR
jgi:hypothetical protein